MKLLGAKLRGIFAKFSEALPPSFAKATEGSPRLHPRSKLRGIRRRRIKNFMYFTVTITEVSLLISFGPAMTVPPPKPKIVESRNMMIFQAQSLCGQEAKKNCRKPVLW